MAVRCTNRRNQTQSLFKSLIRQLSNVYASLFHTNGRQNGCKDRVRLPPCDSPPAKQHFDTRRLSGIGIRWNGKRNRVLGRVQKIAVREGSCRWRFLVACNKPVHDEKQKNSERRKEKNRERRKKRNRERRERERGREGERKREMAGGLVQRNRSSERFCLPTRTFNEKDRFSESVIRIACFCPIPMSWRALENFARASVETGSTTKCREKGMLKVVRDGKQSNFSKSSGCALVQYGFWLAKEDRSFVWMLRYSDSFN